MHVEVINQQAEEKLLRRMETDQAIGGALHIQSSRVSSKLNEEVIIFTTRAVLDGRKASVYFMHDGDIVITWQGAQKAIINALRSEICDRLHITPDESLDCYYDTHAQGEELRQILKQKLVMVPAAASELELASPTEEAVVKPPAALKVTNTHIINFHKAAKERATRKHLEILVVEDQPFSAKLLAGLLGRIFNHVYIAPDASKGLDLYAWHAPNVVFLDIEMPDINGHELAAAINQLDPESYVIMVTANHYMEDVERAKANNAKAFVVKPFSKLKILGGIEKYIQEHMSKA